MNPDERHTLAIRALLQMTNALALARRAAEKRDAAIMASMRAAGEKLTPRGRRILYAFHAAAP